MFIHRTLFYNLWYTIVCAALVSVIVYMGYGSLLKALLAYTGGGIFFLLFFSGLSLLESTLTNLSYKKQ